MQIGLRKWYAPLLLLLVACFVPWLNEQRRVGGIEKNILAKTAPWYTQDQAYAEFKWVKERKLKWGLSPGGERNLPDDPKAYWEFYNRDAMLRDALQRTINETVGPEAMVAERWLQSISTGMQMNIIQDRFNQKFSVGLMLEARPEKLYSDDRKLPEIPNSKLEKFGVGYIWSILVMASIFVLRLRIKGLLVYPEVPKIALAAIFWPIGILVFPGDIRREEQMKKGLFILAQLSSLSLVFIGFGPAVVVLKAQPKTREGTEKSERKKTSKFSIGTELYPITSGVDQGLMVAPWYAHSHEFENGVTVSGFGFVEAGPDNRRQLFTNHSLNLSHSDARGAMFSFEYGGSYSGDFAQIGPRINLVRSGLLPSKTGKVAKTVVTGSFWRIRGPTHYQEFFLGWVSREANLPYGLKLSTEGFMRFRPGTRANVGQPQIILRHPKIQHTQFMTEFWMIGKDPTIRFGFQFSK